MGNHFPWLVRIVLVVVIFSTGLPHKSFAQSIAQEVQTDATAGTNQAADAQRLQPLYVASSNDGTAIRWSGVSAASTAALDQLPTRRYHGYELPMQLITVTFKGNALSTDRLMAASALSDLVEIQALSSTLWQEEIIPAAPLQPTAIDAETGFPIPAFAETVALPESPLFLLRQGLFNHQPIAIWAFSPIYRDQTGIRLVTDFAAQIKQTTPLDHARLHQLTAKQSVEEQSASAGDTAHSTIPQVDPINADAKRSAIILAASTVGMQEVTGADLAKAGLDLATVNPALLQLKYMGNEVAIALEGLSNGKLTATSTLRFFAATIGDRWNRTSLYWLTIGSSAGQRMTTRSVTPGSATQRNSVFEEGTWRDPKLYDSRYAGSSGDHWFHAKLIPALGGATPESISIDVNTHLPRIAGTASFTVALTTNIRGEHLLQLGANGDSQTIAWNSVISNTFIANQRQPYATTTQSSRVQVALLSVTGTNAQSDPAVFLDQLSWSQPVALNLQQSGAAFIGVPGTWRYNWSGLPTEYRFYDVTDPVQPVLLTGSTATAFQDGPVARHYIVTASDTMQKPTVTAHAPVTFGKVGADALYITHGNFVTALEPLLQLRRDQGYKVAAINVQEIFDAWSYGHVSADAIRTFLRYTYINWSPTPVSVVLVGDGTWDPHNYEQKGNQNFIPPYLAEVDPWLGEAACENCYVQLNGDDPLTGDNLLASDGPSAQFFDTDMWIGRLPVKSSGELTNLINKLISYETADSIELWQNKLVMIADNYIRDIDTDGKVLVDLAGDFAKYSDNVVELSPTAIDNARIYYDPYPEYSNPDNHEPWRITDAAQALRSVMQNLSTGAGVVVYNGHSNQWQWAVTDESADANPDYLLGLYDTDALTNRNRYFISLSMTCLTGQFHKPALSGTVLDERMLLNPNGGAIAVWGPAGLSVAYGHDFLQRGFFEALWQAPPGTARIGELIEAGYIKLLTEDTCCQDTAKTFLLLGDPLTKARAYPSEINGLYLPTIRR